MPGVAVPGERNQHHVPALDGLRGVAVAAVVVYHFAPARLPAGFLGVDLFFVLSGFLITTLLVHEVLDTGRIDLRAFWGRRARRLLPAALLTLVAITVVALVAGTRTAGLRTDVLAALGYGSNWHQVLTQQSYFDVFGAPNPTKHFWSLAIEEQFYLLWPVLVAVGAAVILRHGAPLPSPPPRVGCAGRGHRGVGDRDGGGVRRDGRRVEGVLRHRHPGVRVAGRGVPGGGDRRPSGPIVARRPPRPLAPSRHRGGGRGGRRRVRGHHGPLGRSHRGLLLRWCAALVRRDRRRDLRVDHHGFGTDARGRLRDLRRWARRTVGRRAQLESPSGAGPGFLRRHRSPSTGATARVGSSPSSATR